LYKLRFVTFLINEHDDDDDEYFDAIGWLGVHQEGRLTCKKYIPVSKGFCVAWYYVCWALYNFVVTDVLAEINGH